MQEKATTPYVIPPTMSFPAAPATVNLSLTIIFSSLYGLLFLAVYVQLWMVLMYKHKRLSYQTVFLYLCLIWAGLRTTLFAFYFNNAEMANSFNAFLYWLFYCCPVCLQFITLCLMVLYFAQVVFRARGRFEANLKIRFALRISMLIAILIFLVTNVTCAVLGKQYEYETLPAAIVVSRVVINDSLFILLGSCLSMCVYKLRKTSTVNLLLEAKGTSICQAMTVCTCLIVLFCSRAVYNITAIIARHCNHVPAFGYGWINASDQADLMNLSKGYAYASFGIVLFAWEFLPTFFVIWFFRVHKPENTLTSIDISSRSSTQKVYFFDNPRRYDSDDDLSTARSGTPSVIDHSSLSGSVNTSTASATSPRYGSFGHYYNPPIHRPLSPLPPSSSWQPSWQPNLPPTVLPTDYHNNYYRTHQ